MEMWCGFMAANLSRFTRQGSASVGHLKGLDTEGGTGGRECNGGRGKERTKGTGRGEGGSIEGRGSLAST